MMNSSKRLLREIGRRAGPQPIAVDDFLLPVAVLGPRAVDTLTLSVVQKKQGRNHTRRLRNSHVQRSARVSDPAETARPQVSRKSGDLRSVRWLGRETGHSAGGQRPRLRAIHAVGHVDIAALAEDVSAGFLRRLCYILLPVALTIRSFDRGTP